MGMEGRDDEREGAAPMIVGGSTVGLGAGVDPGEPVGSGAGS